DVGYERHAAVRNDEHTLCDLDRPAVDDRRHRLLADRGRCSIALRHRSLLLVRVPCAARLSVSTLPRVSDERRERGLDAYASQFGIDRDEVTAWFEERFGRRFGEEAIN